MRLYRIFSNWDEILVVIRGTNTEEIRSHRPLQVIGREAIAGVLLRGMLGTIATIWAYFLQGR